MLSTSTMRCQSNLMGGVVNNVGESRGEQVLPSTVIILAESLTDCLSLSLLSISFFVSPPFCHTPARIVQYLSSFVLFGLFLVPHSLYSKRVGVSKFTRPLQMLPSEYFLGPLTSAFPL